MESSPESAFSSQSLSMRAQKKILGKMASRNVAKHFISDTAARFLDNVYRMLKDFYSKKEAEKIVKNVIKLIIKLNLLIRNEQFSVDETAVADQFQKKLRLLMMSLVSFFEVEFSYDRNYLINLINECHNLIQTLIKQHLSDKSVQRVQMIFAYCGDGDFLDSLFVQYRSQMESVCNDLNKLLENGEL